MKLIHIVSSLSSHQGGPAHWVPGLCEGVARRGATVKIIASDTRRVYGKAIEADPGLTSTITVPSFTSDRLRIVWSPGFRGVVEQELRRERVSLVHVHGAWLPSVHAGCTLARSHRIPYIITPLGMLLSWALKRRRWKKRLAWTSYQRRDVEGAALLHATAPAEAEELRSLGLRNPIAVVPHGVDVPDQVERVRHSDTRIALYLSRIHPTKGILNLIRAWANIRPSGWRLIIVGPNEENHRPVVEREILMAGLGDMIEVRDPVHGPEKWKIFAESDLFILPTFSESFGIAVAEALARGVPVVTTHGAPWPELVTFRCGWWVPVGVDTLTAAIREAIGLSDDERREMGERGKQLVREHCGWAGVADRMFEAYQWVLRGGKRPEFIWS